MKTKRKRGRRPYTVADRRLMAEVSEKFRKYITDHKIKKIDAAVELGVCLASFYNYLAMTDLPGVAVLRIAHKKWDLDFKYADYNLDDGFFEKAGRERGPVREEQMALPFIEALRTEDIEILAVVPKRPNAVEMRLRIRFAG